MISIWFSCDKHPKLKMIFFVDVFLHSANHWCPSHSHVRALHIAHNRCGKANAATPVHAFKIHTWHPIILVASCAVKPDTMCTRELNQLPTEGCTSTWFVARLNLNWSVQTCLANTCGAAVGLSKSAHNNIIVS